jgi:hypothetical protein
VALDHLVFLHPVLGALQQRLVLRFVPLLTCDKQQLLIHEGFVVHALTQLNSQEKAEKV